MKIQSSKLPKLQTSIFTTMGKMAHEFGAVNLSQGFPNFDVDPKLLELVNQAMIDGHNQYASMQGVYTIRERIAEKIESLYGKSYSPEHEITITAGATQGLFTAISTFINAGDEVIVLKPAYDCYEPAIELYGGVVVPVQLGGKEFQVDWSRVADAISPKTKMLIINTPHNPSGTLLTKADMLKLQALVKDTNIIVLSDEVYEHLVFDGHEHESVAKYPELASRTFIFSSFGKTFHITGWKVGYCVAPKELMAEFQKVHEYNVFCVNHPAQKGLAAYLKNPEHYLKLNNFYQEKRDYFLNAISTSRFQFKPAAGTYFQLLEYGHFNDEPDTKYAERLVKENKIASIPISVFNLNHLDNRQLRFCFAKTNETLDKAAEILNVI